MNLTLTITPESVSIGKETLSQDQIERIALHSKVIDKSKPGKLIVEFDKKKAFILPRSVVFESWNLITKR